MERGVYRRLVQSLLPVFLAAVLVACGDNHCRLDLTPDSGTTGTQVSLRACEICGQKNPKPEKGKHVTFSSEPDCPCGGPSCSLCAPTDPVTNADGCVDASLSLTDTNATELQVTVLAQSKDSEDSSAYVLTNGAPAPTSTPGGSPTPGSTPTPEATPPTPTPTPCAMQGQSCGGVLGCCSGTCLPIGICT